MIHAQCSCGGLRLTLPGPSQMVVACHCVACQRRTGSPFGVGAYYPAEAVTIAGPSKGFVRPTDTGRSLRSFFCPQCGSSVYWIADLHPTMIGVAIGAIADARQAPPLRSVWEQTKCDWVVLEGVPDHFERGRGG